MEQTGKPKGELVRLTVEKAATSEVGEPGERDPGQRLTAANGVDLPAGPTS